MFRSIRRASLGLAALFMVAVAFSACGGEESETSRTRNAASFPATCAEGGECVIGDTGPGGGTVFYVGETEKPWGKYLEAAPVKWTKPSPEDDPRARFSPGFPNAQKGLSPENLGPGFGRHAWGKVSDYRCGDCISDLIAAYNQGAIKDWYLPNVDEMQILINSNTRRVNRNQYWTATGVYTQDATPRMVMLQFTPKTGVWGRTGFWHQTMTYSFVPIRAFAATVVEVEQELIMEEETTTTSNQITQTTEDTKQDTSTTEPSSLSQTGLLKAPTNLQVSFNNENIEVTFDLQEDGLAPDGHLVMMEWSFGQNSVKLHATENSTSVWIPNFERGKIVRVKVRSYANPPKQPQIADTAQISIEIPKIKSIEPPQPPSDEVIVNTIALLNMPVLILPPEEVKGDIDSEKIMNDIESQLPEIEIKKIEVLVSNPKTENQEKFVEISKTEQTPYVISPDATEVTIRVTGTKGEVVEQTKLIVRVADTGVEITPVAPSSVATTTTPDSSETKSPSTTVKPEAEATTTTNGETAETIVEPEETAETPDPASDGNSSGTNPIVWLLIAVIALLLTAFAAQRMKKTKD
jgi:hypothetical protein